MREHLIVKRTKTQGFTLVELAVVVVIIGILAAFAVPRFRASVERTRSAEAFNFLATLRASQERYQYLQGTYADDLDDLDVVFTTPEFYSIFTTIAAGPTGLENSWTCTMTRSGDTGGYGAYTVTFTEEGWDRSASSIPDAISPTQVAST